jgi:hypothetical protein
MTIQHILFNTPAGNVGTSETYTLNDVSIKAYGYNIGSPNTPTDLFGKNDGPNETGLGMDSDSDNEINTTTFVMLDISNLFSKECENKPTITVGSIQSGEGFYIYGSNVLGELGTLLLTQGDSALSQTVTIPEFGHYQYISITATDGNVVLYSLDYELCCEPEPCKQNFVDIPVEIKPIVKICFDTPLIQIKNKALCICTPCKPKPH